MDGMATVEVNNANGSANKDTKSKGHHTKTMPPNEDGNNTFWDVHTACALSYLLALIGFGCAFNLKDLPNLPYPIIGNLLDSAVMHDKPDMWEEGIVIIGILFMITYVRRILLITLENCYYDKRVLASDQEGIVQPSSATISNDSTVGVSVNDVDVRDGGSTLNPPTRRLQPQPRHRKSISRPTFFSLFGASVVYHITFGVWLGWACNGHIRYFASDTPYLVAGLLTYVAGEVTCYVTMIPRVRYVEWYQRRCGWRAVAEAGEVLSIAGLAVYTLTLPACVFGVLRIVLIACSVLTPNLDTRVF